VNRARDTGSFVVPREKLERQKLKMLFVSPLMKTVEEAYLKNYIYREPINTLEELNDRIHEVLAILLFLICLFFQMKAVNLLTFVVNYSFYFACFLFHLLHSTSFHL
jgi:hypothetical protein